MKVKMPSETRPSTIGAQGRDRPQSSVFPSAERPPDGISEDLRFGNVDGFVLRGTFLDQTKILLL